MTLEELEVEAYRIYETIDLSLPHPDKYIDLAKRFAASQVERITPYGHNQATTKDSEELKVMNRIQLQKQAILKDLT